MENDAKSIYSGVCKKEIDEENNILTIIGFALKVSRILKEIFHIISSCDFGAQLSLMK